MGWFGLDWGNAPSPGELFYEVIRRGTEPLIPTSPEDREEFYQYALPGAGEGEVSPASFAVGADRIITNRVGEGTNITLPDAWDATDDVFNGWLPGGVKPRIPEPLKDIFDNLSGIAVALGLGLMAFMSREK